jgi:uncharacterized protein YuzE
MTISRNEHWIQIAELDKDDQICFTPAFREVMEDIGWEAKAFVGHLLGLWYDPFEHILDYSSGEARHSEDQPGPFDRNDLDKPQEVVEYWAEQWSKNGRKFIGQVRPKDIGGKKRMKIRYDMEADILLFVLREDPPVDAIEEPGGVIVSYGEDKEPVSVEFLNASARRLIHPGEVSVTVQTKGIPV